jgi:hypothetical protein
MLTIVHDLADNGIRIRDLNQVKFGFLSFLKSLWNRNNTNLVSIRADQTAFGGTYIFIDWRQRRTAPASVITPDSYIS